MMRRFFAKTSKVTSVAENIFLAEDDDAYTPNVRVQYGNDIIRVTLDYSHVRSSTIKELKTATLKLLSEKEITDYPRALQGDVTNVSYIHEWAIIRTQKKIVVYSRQQQSGFTLEAVDLDVGKVFDLLQTKNSRFNLPFFTELRILTIWGTLSRDQKECLKKLSFQKLNYISLYELPSVLMQDITLLESLEKMELSKFKAFFGCNPHRLKQILTFVTIEHICGLNTNLPPVPPAPQAPTQFQRYNLSTFRTVTSRNTFHVEFVNSSSPPLKCTFTNYFMTREEFYAKYSSCNLKEEYLLEQWVVGKKSATECIMYSLDTELLILQTGDSNFPFNLFIWDEASNPILYFSHKKIEDSLTSIGLSSRFLKQVKGMSKEKIKILTSTYGGLGIWLNLGPDEANLDKKYLTLEELAQVEDNRLEYLTKNLDMVAKASEFVDIREILGIAISSPRLGIHRNSFHNIQPRAYSYASSSSSSSSSSNSRPSQCSIQ